MNLTTFMGKTVEDGPKCRTTMASNINIEQKTLCDLFQHNHQVNGNPRSVLTLALSKDKLEKVCVF